MGSRNRVKGSLEKSWGKQLMIWEQSRKIPNIPGNIASVSDLQLAIVQ